MKDNQNEHLFCLNQRELQQFAEALKPLIRENSTGQQRTQSIKQNNNKMECLLSKWYKEMCDSGCISWSDTRVCLAEPMTKPGSKTTDTLLNICWTRNIIDLTRANKNTDREIYGRNRICTKN